MIHVCSLRLLQETVSRHRPSHLVTLMNEDNMPPTPETIDGRFHLRLSMNDIPEPREGLTPPDHGHVEELVAFARDWDRSAPMLIHCWAGISRSTAAAYVTLCTLNPRVEEDRIARLLRATSPSATPNPRIVALADNLMNRQGRMISAIAEIGRGETAFEGEPFGISPVIE